MLLFRTVILLVLQPAQDDWARSCCLQGQAERQQMLMAVDQALRSKQAAPSGSREG